MFLRLSVSPRWREKAANCHELVRVVQMSRDWFGSVFVVNFDIFQMFADLVSQCITFLHKVQVMQKIRLVKIRVKWSVTVTVHLGTVSKYYSPWS